VAGVKLAEAFEACVDEAAIDRVVEPAGDAGGMR
jgi:hypothetical protein